MISWTGSHENQAALQLATLFISHQDRSSNCLQTILKHNMATNLPQAQWNYETPSTENKYPPHCRAIWGEGGVQLSTVIVTLPPPLPLRGSHQMTTACHYITSTTSAACVYLCVQVSIRRNLNTWQQLLLNMTFCAHSLCRDTALGSDYWQYYTPPNINAPLAQWRHESSREHNWSVSQLTCDHSAQHKPRLHVLLSHLWASSIQCSGLSAALVLGWVSSHNPVLNRTIHFIYTGIC